MAQHARVREHSDPIQSWLGPSLSRHAAGFDSVHEPRPSHSTPPCRGPDYSWAGLLPPLPLPYPYLYAINVALLRLLFYYYNYK